MKNDILHLSVEAAGSGGEGIAKREDGYTLFVPGAVPGDKIKALVLKENKSFGYAKLIEVEEPSPHRTAPVCGLFGKCGGCSMLATDYAFQLEIKRQRVTDALERIGGFKNPPVRPCIGSEPNLAYRNKAQYPVTERDGRLAAGFYAPNSHRVVSGGSCALQDTRITDIVSFVVDKANELKLSAYDESSGRGCLRHIYVRTGASEAVLVLVAACEDKRLAELGRSAAERFPYISGVVLNFNPKKTNLILGDKQKILYGRDYIIDKIGEVSYKVHYKSFYQVNSHTTHILYDKAAEYCALTGGETVFDLYCGAGTIGLYLAGRAGRIIGVELVPEAVENARENAAMNGIENAEYYCGRAEEICPELIKNGVSADAVILDPPRKGCGEELLRAAAAMSPKRIVYVSCDPATMARDCKILAEAGYEPVEVTPVDQFPHTGHVECVVLLRNERCY